MGYRYIKIGLKKPIMISYIVEEARGRLQEVWVLVGDSHVRVLETMVVMETIYELPLI